jgi:protocatechuate 4,5-dioxygenase beta chain
MAKIVGGFLFPHDPLITAQPDAAPAEKREAVAKAFRRIRTRVREMGADTVIVVGDDHYTMFGPHCIPQALIVIGDAAGPCEPWVGFPKESFRINEPLATHIMNYGLDHGVDWAVAKSIDLDHSTSMPIHMCVQDQPDISVIPVIVNSGVAPLIRSKRCLQIGRSMREAVLSWKGADRVAIFGTGGISHWPGMAQIGRVNPQWDRMIIDHVRNNDLQALVALTDEEIMEHSGNGGLEIKNWIVALGFMGTFDAELIDYQPIPEWVTGCAFMELAA